MSSRTLYSSQTGMTLVEMVIAIAIAGIAIAGLTSSFSSIVGRTADPMILTQSQISAESLMEEILLKPFIDLGINPDTETDICGAQKEDQDGDDDDDGTRASFDDVCDYQGYTSSGITDQNDNPVVGLENYDVSVTVVNSSFGGIAAANSLLVTVTVTNPLGNDVVLSAYRTQ